MLSYRLSTFTDFYWGLNQFSAIANLTLTKYFGEVKKIMHKD